MQSAFLHYTLVPLTDEHSSIREPIFSVTVQIHVFSLARKIFEAWSVGDFVLGVKSWEKVRAERILGWSAIRH
jgi:hypothetical protein